ncbi:MAG TPA: DUF559 domain-containing protein [Bacteroidota bacterium]|nr:DUF559 domain-containing protein [Bacteroidota bacterium]
MHRRFSLYHPRLKKVARMLRKNSTRAEILLWGELKGKQMLGYDFHRQKPLGNYVVDFFSPRLKLVIEIDGSSHEERTNEDKKRQRNFEERGFRFLRFPDDEVKQNVEGVVEDIRAWIFEHGKK